VGLERIDVVEGAVDTEVFSPRVRGSRGAPGQVRLLFVGNIIANKGVHAVFDAFMRLAPLHPELSLAIAGSGDDEIAEQMRRDAAGAGLAERVDLLGFVEHSELPALYRAADVLAAPSQYEGGLGMVYLEAMACGLPVVATAAGGAAEAVVDGETGILLPRADADEATRAIETLLREPELRNRMGSAGRARVEQRFTVERYAQRVAEAYERAVERRAASVTVW
jgi:glycosyltransferase involved in cell wall biosynthesis